MWDERAGFIPLICWGLDGVFAAFWRPSQCRLEMAAANTASLARLDVNLSLGAMRLGKSFASLASRLRHDATTRCDRLTFGFAQEGHGERPQV
jgi:hypothetical protein